MAIINKDQKTLQTRFCNRFGSEVYSKELAMLARNSRDKKRIRSQDCVKKHIKM